MELVLPDDHTTIFDDQDWPSLCNFDWFCRHHHRNQYAATKVKIDGRWRTIDMQRVLLGLDFGDAQIADHIDGNGLNNQRSNLRAVSIHQSNWNRRAHQDSGSPYKGVSWHKYPSGSGGKWRARIKVNGKDHHIGFFINEEDAARAVDRLLVELCGEYVRLNFPGGG